MLGFTQPHSDLSKNFKIFIQFLPGSYKSDKSIKTTGNDKLLLKCDCINGSIVNGARGRILYSCALEKPTGHENYKQPGVNQKICPCCLIQRFI